MAIDAIQVPTSYSMQTPKSKRMYKMGIVGVKIAKYQALKLTENTFSHPFDIGWV